MLVKITLNDSDEDVRMAGVKSLTFLAEVGTLTQSINVEMTFSQMFFIISSSQN